MSPRVIRPQDDPLDACSVSENNSSRFELACWHGYYRSGPRSDVKQCQPIPSSKGCPMFPFTQTLPFTALGPSKPRGLRPQTPPKDEGPGPRLGSHRRLRLRGLSVSESLRPFIVASTKMASATPPNGAPPTRIKNPARERGNRVNGTKMERRT